jgi:outer membrane protein
MLSIRQRKTRTPYAVILLVLLFPYRSNAQNTPDTLLQEATLEKVVQYALVHQPAVQQALVDEEITNKMIKGKLADWYPQVNFVYNYQRFFDLQTSVIGGNEIRFGVNNTSAMQVNATQSIFNRDVLLASSTASTVRTQATQNTSRNKIDVVVDVTKAFYDVLATLQQIKVGEEDIIRLQRSLRDARSQYSAGVADKTDYKRATILLGNAEASLKTNTELLKYKQEYLKTLMGYPQGNDLAIQYDTLQMENEIALDTLQQINYSEHIDYKILFMQKELQEANVKYSYWAYIPTLSAFGSYILNYQNDTFSELYATRYPFSYVGATLTFPIFQGGKRSAKIQEEKWALKRLDWDVVNLKNNLSTEYTRALASYKGNLATYLVLKENVELAKEVYDIIQLQYKNGVKAYLDVTIAETDLRTTRINYFNALYQVLASKMDVQRALGQINY